jgi:hypothetical protein
MGRAGPRAAASSPIKRGHYDQAAKEMSKQENEPPGRDRPVIQALEETRNADREDKEQERHERRQKDGRLPERSFAERSRALTGRSRDRLGLR